MVDRADVLRRFTIRARRVRAHSMAVDIDTLRAFATGAMTISTTIGGPTKVTRRLPQDEEVFESLAARLRPLTLSSEPVYWKKVLAAIRDGIDEAENVNDANRAEFEAIAKAWSVIDLQGVGTLSYSVQQASLDGSNATEMVSDTQLAAAWLYADLVHSKATGQKKKALDFPLKERYAAATRYFSHVALLTIRTFDLIERLHDAGILLFSESAWTEEVVVAQTDLVEDATAYLSDLGTAPPDMANGLALPLGWEELTVTGMVHASQPNKRAEIILFDGDGEIERLPAAVLAKEQSESETRARILVADGIEMTMVLQRNSGETSIGFKMLDMNNRTRLHCMQVSKSIAAATHMTVAVAEIGVVERAELPPKDQDRAWDAWIDVLGDLCAIENALGKPFENKLEGFTVEDRVKIRIARYLIEGRVTRIMAQPQLVTMPGDQPPGTIKCPSFILSIDSISMTVPDHYLWHPQMIVNRIEDPDLRGSEKTRWQARPPDGQRFLAWAQTDEAQLARPDAWEPTPWRIPGVVE